jgi:hypothetical protein
VIGAPEQVAVMTEAWWSSPVGAQVTQTRTARSDDDGGLGGVPTE